MFETRFKKTMYPPYVFTHFTVVLFMLISDQNQVVSIILSYLKHLLHIRIACFGLVCLKLHKRIVNIGNTRGDKRRDRAMGKFFMRQIMPRKLSLMAFLLRPVAVVFHFEALLQVLSAHLLHVGQNPAGFYFQLPSSTTWNFVELCHLCGVAFYAIRKLEQLG